MIKPYYQITSELARQIRLVVTDFDGTLTGVDGSLGAGVFEAIRQLEAHGITVGLASGRMISRLDSLAQDLGLSGILIAENGGVARLKPNGELIELGYSRQPAIEALAKLKVLFPGLIKEREDNLERRVDVVIWPQGVDIETLKKHLGDTQLLYSGYMLHLMQKGVSKGRTLLRLLGQIGDGSLSPTEVMVFGDSETDISLFQFSRHSVQIVNPKLSVEQRQALEKVASYTAELPSGDGFVQVVSHLLQARCSRE